MQNIKKYAKLLLFAYLAYQVIAIIGLFALDIIATITKAIM